MNMPDFERQFHAWAAGVLRGKRSAWPWTDGVNAAMLTRQLEREGVAGLLAARLGSEAGADDIPAPMRQAIRQQARVEAVTGTYQLHWQQRVLARLARAGLAPLVLKGAALGHWAYPRPSLRVCGDFDLLFADHPQAARAIAAVQELGYAPPAAILPGDLVCFELSCDHASDPHAPQLDLHWRLSSTPLFAFRFAWDELQAASQPLPTLTAAARGLAPVHAWLHACMHRLQNRANYVADKLRWRCDLQQIGAALSPVQWQELVELASARGLAGTCLDGLDACRASFGPLAPDAVRARLRAAAAREALRPERMDRWWYVQRRTMVALPTRAQRWRWLRQRLLPDRAWLRARYGAHASLPRALLARAGAALRRALQAGN